MRVCTAGAVLQDYRWPEDNIKYSTNIHLIIQSEKNFFPASTEQYILGHNYRFKRAEINLLNSATPGDPLVGPILHYQIYKGLYVSNRDANTEAKVMACNFK